MKKKAICCFTGHREIAYEHGKALSVLLDGILERLIAHGFTEFRTGGALGFDTVVALKIIEKKKSNKNIRLHLFLPCREQADMWTAAARQAYLFTIENADEVTYISDKYVKGCMLQRDRCLVNGSALCVGYCMKSTGGTAYTLGYARSQNVRTVNIATLLKN